MHAQPARFESAMFTFPDSDEEQDDGQYTVLLELVAGVRALHPAAQPPAKLAQLLLQWASLPEADAFRASLLSPARRDTLLVDNHSPQLEPSPVVPPPAAPVPPPAAPVPPPAAPVPPRLSPQQTPPQERCKHSGALQPETERCFSRGREPNAERHDGGSLSVARSPPRRAACRPPNDQSLSDTELIGKAPREMSSRSRQSPSRSAERLNLAVPSASSPPPPGSEVPRLDEIRSASGEIRSPLDSFGASGERHLLLRAGARVATADLECAILEQSFAHGTLSVEELALHLESALSLPKAVALLLSRRATLEGGGDDGGGARASYASIAAVAANISAADEDDARLFRAIRSSSSPFVSAADLEALCWVIADVHPGLEFLKAPGSEQFRSAYVLSVVQRLLWGLEGFGTPRVTLQQWRRSSLPQVLRTLDGETDLNLATHFFSYSHVYVMWCLFCELDEDDDALLTQDDLLRYGSYGLSSRVVERVWMLRRDVSTPGMVYADFVFFLLAEEDKESPAALSYWFHVLDCDGDGYLSVHDMAHFYEEQERRLTAMGEECVPLCELLNEFNDMVSPKQPSRMTCSELRRCGLGFNVVSALTNVRKYLAWEALACEKAAGRANDLRGRSDWDWFAEREYQRLVDEEGSQEWAGEESEEDEEGVAEQTVDAEQNSENKRDGAAEEGGTAPAPASKARPLDGRPVVLSPPLAAECMVRHLEVEVEPDRRGELEEELLMDDR